MSSVEYTKEQLDAVMVDEAEYEFMERFAILMENNPQMHTLHAKNKAIKEIKFRILNDRMSSEKTLTKTA